MSFWIVAFFVILILGVGMGIIRDVASTETGVREATVIDNKPNKPTYRWPTTPPAIKVRIADGNVVDVYTRGGTEPADGSTVTVRELTAPWGPVWYKLKD